jgi:hypothetical protein
MISPTILRFIGARCGLSGRPAVELAVGPAIGPAIDPAIGPAVGPAVDAAERIGQHRDLPVEPLVRHGCAERAGAERLGGARQPSQRPRHPPAEVHACRHDGETAEHDHRPELRGRDVGVDQRHRDRLARHQAPAEARDVLEGKRRDRRGQVGRFIRPRLHTRVRDALARHQRRLQRQALALHFRRPDQHRTVARQQHHVDGAAAAPLGEQLAHRVPANMRAQYANRHAVAAPHRQREVDKRHDVFLQRERAVHIAGERPREAGLEPWPLNHAHSLEHASGGHDDHARGIRHAQPGIIRIGRDDRVEPQPQAVFVLTLRSEGRKPLHFLPLDPQAAAELLGYRLGGGLQGGDGLALGDEARQVDQHRQDDQRRADRDDHHAGDDQTPKSYPRMGRHVVSFFVVRVPGVRALLQEKRSRGSQQRSAYRACERIDLI